MRASTLFALTLAVVLGLAAAVAVKVSGVLDKPAPPVVAKPAVKVLVAGRNLFAGDLVDANWVTTRDLRPDELAHYEQNKDQYLPAVAQAVYLRVAAKNIEADKPLLKEYFQDMQKPENVSARLLPNMRAVNVSVPKDESVGGLIQVGEWVDVLLTTNVSLDGKESTRTAAIAHKLRVVAKRNALWPVFAPLPEDKPVHYTLEANPYRVALIEFAKGKGQLSLVPLSATEKRILEEKRNLLLQQANVIKPVSFADPVESSEYRDEEGRVDAINRGELNVNNLDLVRIFDLKTAEPPPAPVMVQQYAGVTRFAPAMFRTDGSIIDPDRNAGRSSSASSSGRDSLGLGGSEVRFTSPAEGCKTCGKGKKK